MDDRESRLRTALMKLEKQDGRISRESLIRVVTVSSSGEQPLLPHLVPYPTPSGIS